jgi:hypothetical protein
MNRSLLLAVLFCCYGAASAQVVSVTNPTTSEFKTVTSELSSSVSSFATLPAPSKLAEVVGVYYHDPQIQPFIWNIPVQYSASVASVAIGQRFTLPAATGYLDSILIWVRTLPIGDIRFEVMKDFLQPRFTTSDTTKFHYPDYYSTPAGISLIDTARLNAFDFDSLKYSKVDFNAKSVPQEFHITMWPTSAAGISNGFGVVCDSYSEKEKDVYPTNARSSIMVFSSSTGKFGLYLMEQVFRSSTDTSRHLLSNFYMVAFARVGTVSGMEQVAIPSGVGLDQNYPNPVGSAAPFTTIAFETEKTGYATLDVFDAVGRKIASLHDGMLAAGKHSKVFITSSLAPGMYNYRLNLDGKQAMRRMIVVK